MRRAPIVTIASIAWLAIACSGTRAPSTATEHKPTHLPDATLSNGSGSDGGGAAVKVVIDTPFTLEILGLEAVGHPGPSSWAQRLTAELVAAAREYDAIRIGPAGTRQLVDEKLLANCETEQPTCMAKIAKAIPADRMIYGRIDGSRVSLKLIVAATEAVIGWDAPAFDFSSDATIRSGAREAMASLLSRSP